MEEQKPFHIVLVEPEIPPNTGNIARLCGATRSILHLVGKLGFSTDDRALKRAGLDYWQEVDIRYWRGSGRAAAGLPGRALHLHQQESGKVLCGNGIPRGGLHRLRQGDPGTSRCAAGGQCRHLRAHPHNRPGAQHKPGNGRRDRTLRGAPPDGKA